MKKLFTFFFCLTATFLLSQDPSLNISILDNWDPDTLPTSGGIDYNDIWGYTDCKGNEYAIIGSAARIHFFDVTNATDIKELASFDGGQVTVWRDFKTYRDRAYAVSDNTAEGLIIFDMSQVPDTVIKTYQSNEFFNKAHNIFIDEPNGRLYAAGSNSADMVVLDIAADPDNPALLANVSLPGGGYVHDIYVKDNIAYCSHGYNGFYVWNFTDPQNPVMKAHVVTGGYNHSSWLTDDARYAIFAEEVPIGQPLGMIDLSDVENGEIEVVKTFKFPLLAPVDENNRPHNPFIRGQFAIVSYYHDGLQIINIGDPLNPELIAYYDTYDNAAYSGFAGAWGTYPFLPSGNILVSDIERGLFVMRADSIELKPIKSIADPDVEIEVIGLNPFCEGTTTNLQVADSAMVYQWYKDGEAIPTANGNRLQVDSPGSYWVVAANGHCENISAPIAITSVPAPDLSQMVSGELTVCEGDELLIEAPAGLDFYIWSKDNEQLGEDDSTLAVLEPGTYSLTAFKDGCSSVSNDIVVDFKELPNANISVSDSIFCKGIPVRLEVAGGQGEYAWFENGQSTGIVTPFTDVTDSGNFYVSITGPFGCTQNSEVISIEFNDPIVPTIDNIENILTSSAAMGYQWYLNGAPINGATSQTYTATESGEYSVLVTDANGCQAESAILELVITGIAFLDGELNWSISPNPANHYLKLSFQTGQPTALSLSILNVTGKQVLAAEIIPADLHSLDLDISGLSSGIYMVMLNVEGQVEVEKFVKE